MFSNIFIIAIDSENNELSTCIFKSSNYLTALFGDGGWLNINTVRIKSSENKQQLGASKSGCSQ